MQLLHLVGFISLLSMMHGTTNIKYIFKINYTNVNILACIVLRYTKVDKYVNGLIYHKKFSFKRNFSTKDT